VFCFLVVSTASSCIFKFFFIFLTVINVLIHLCIYVYAMIVYNKDVYICVIKLYTQSNNKTTKMPR
jgi:hypothetical protein